MVGIDEDIIKSYFRYATMMCGVACLAYFMLLGMRMAISPILPVLGEEFGWTHTQLGALVSILFISYAVMQIPSGIIGDKWGGRKTVTFGLLLSSVFFLLFGFAWDYTSALVFRFLLGIGTALGWAPMTRMIMGWTTYKRRATYNSLWNAFGTVGTAFCMIVAPIICALMGWRWVFFLFSIGGFIACILSWVIFRDNPEDKGFPTIAELDRITVEHAQRPISDANQESSYYDVLKTPMLWVLCITSVLGGGVFYTVPVWLPTTLEDFTGVSLATAGSISSVYLWAGVFGGPVGGIIADRTRSRKWTAVIGLFIAALALAFSATLFRPGSNIIGLSIVLAIGGFFALFMYSTMPLLAETVGIKNSGLAVAILNTFVCGVGATVMPILCGWIIDTYNSFSMIWYLFALFSAISAVITMVGIREKKR